HLERSFFAVHEVGESSSGGYHYLHNGTTLHGVQALDEEYEKVPLSYYYLTGPLGQVFEELGKRDERHSVAAVGLGTGAVASYTRPGQTMTFYEIDPAVERIATNPAYFTYLKHCPGTCEIILGDGRLQLAMAPDHHYELIILDAYSSTAIPIHLLTKEAVEMYLDKLTDDGIIAFHISNRHLDLEPALTQLANELGLVTRYQDYRADDPSLYNLYVDGSDWVIMARTPKALGPIAFDDRWVEFGVSEGVRIWTDDYAAIIQAYRFPFTPFWSWVESLIWR
ncbi:MAG: fused MFS/spermidine synthase, partial [Bradymonadaceae bacterium]